MFYTSETTACASPSSGHEHAVKSGMGYGHEVTLHHGHDYLLYRRMDEIMRSGHARENRFRSTVIETRRINA